MCTTAQVQILCVVHPNSQITGTLYVYLMRSLICISSYGVTSLMKLTLQAKPGDPYRKTIQ